MWFPTYLFNLVDPVCNQCYVSFPRPANCYGIHKCMHANMIAFAHSCLHMRIVDLSARQADRKRSRQTSNQTN